MLFLPQNMQIRQTWRHFPGLPKEKKMKTGGLLAAFRPTAC
jgi:hypothetical protein